MSKEEKAREYYKGHDSAPLPNIDGIIKISEDDLFEILSDFANSQKPNILDIAESQPKDIQNLIESVDLLVSQLDDSIGDEFDTYNLDMVKDSLNSLIK